MRRATSLLTMVRALALCAVTMSLGGCATLTVDVDMYKGPLSNHELVQAEQLSATIIGVEPILLGLRNDLEWGEEGLEAYKKKWLKEHTEALQWRREQEVQRVVPLSAACSEQEAWRAYREFELALATYEQDFWPMPIRTEVGSPWLTEPEAIRVNAVLGLYHDLAAEKVRSYVAEIRRCAEQVRACQAVLKPDDDSDRAFWEECERRIAAAKTISKGVRDSLRPAYQDLLYPGKNKGLRRSVVRVGPAHSTVLEQGQKDASVQQVLGRVPRAPAAGAPAGEQFRWLEDTAIIRGHARLLFGREDRDFEDRFVARIHRIVAEFSRGRAAVSDLLCACLSLIESVNMDQGEPVENAPEIRREAIGLAVPLIRCEMLNAAVQSASAPEGTKGLRQALEANLTSPLVPVNGWSAGGNARIDEYKTALRTVLRRDPVEASRQLRILHLAFMVGQWEFPPSGSNEPNYGDPSRREAGIVLAHPVEVDYDGMCSRLAGLAQWSSGAGLDRGRLPEGLETLVDNYLMLVRRLPLEEDRTDEEDAELNRVRSRLANGLVHFGEKVLAIANYDTLLRGSGKSARLPEEQEKRIRPYKDVLQAVGNSIIVQANELSARTEHDQKLQQAQVRESLAIRNAFVPRTTGSSTQKRDNKVDKEPNKPCPTAPDRTAAKPGGNAPGADKTPASSPSIPAATRAGEGRPRDANQPADTKRKDATAPSMAGASESPLMDLKLWEELDEDAYDAKEMLDDLIAVLRYRYAAEVLKSGPNGEQTRNTAAALQTLYEQRADMVYIRPSSAYLRSSYPATSLQQDPEHLGTGNMLVQRVIDTLQAFDKERKERQRRQWDIDKQYWQNVNQIRVSAAGGSNYVVVKDDVGNWYIKGYGADPCCVIQGVRSAALLAATGTGAIAGGAELTTLKTGQRPASPTSSTSAQVEQIKKIDEAYREQFKTDLAALVKDVNGLAAQLCSRWAADPNTKEHFKKPVVEEADKSLVDRCRQLKDSKDPNEARRVVAVFTAIRTFQDKVDAKIAGLPLSAGDKNEPIKKKARDIARRTVCDFLMPRIERCASAVQHQEMVLLVLGTNQGKTDQ